MARPTTQVYFAFNKDSSANWVWNEITTYTRNVSISRGKSSETDSFNAGQCTVTLLNLNRYFDPEYASSPYYGQVKPAGALKVVTSSKTVFIGYIDSWDFAYDEKGLFATATVTAFDALSLLAKAELVAQSFNAGFTGQRIVDVLETSDVSWRDLAGINQGVRQLDTDTVTDGTNVLSYLQDVAALEPGDLFVTQGGSLVFLDNAWTNDSSIALRRLNLCRNADMNLSTTIKQGFIDGSGAIPQTGTRILVGSNYVCKTGVASTTTNLPLAAEYNEVDATKYFVDTTYIFSCDIYQQASAKAILIGGNIGFNPMKYQSYTVPAGSGVTRVYFTLPAVSSLNGSAGVRITLLVNTNVVNDYVYFDNAMIEPTSSQNSYFSGNTTGTAPSGETWTFGFLGTTDYSTSYFDRVLSSPVDYTTPVNVSDSTGTGVNFQDLSMAYASEKLFNRITITGNVGEAINGSSQTLYGNRVLTIDGTKLLDDNNAQALSEYLLDLFATPEYRANQIAFKLHKLSTTDQNTILNTEIGQFLQLKFTPAGGSGAIDKLYKVIAVNHDVDNESHNLVLTVVSLALQPFRWNSTKFGVWDTNRWG